MDPAGANIALFDVLPSAAAAVGVPRCEDRLGIGSADVVIVCLVDGLGASDIEEYPQLFESLTDARGGSISAAFPTTTSTGLASLGTGLPSGQHGIVGASFLLPEYRAHAEPTALGVGSALCRGAARTNGFRAHCDALGSTRWRSGRPLMPDLGSLAPFCGGRNTCKPSPSPSE